MERTQQAENTFWQVSIFDPHGKASDPPEVKTFSTEDDAFDYVCSAYPVKRSDFKEFSDSNHSFANYRKDREIWTFLIDEMFYDGETAKVFRR